MKRHFSIRKSLLLGLTLLIFLTSSTILVSTIIGAFRTSKDLTHKMIDEAGLKVAREVGVYFKEAESTLRILASWIKENDVALDNLDQLGSLLRPVIKESPRVSSILLANDSGAEVLFLQDALNSDSWMIRLVDPTKWLNQAYIRKWNEREGVTSEGLQDFEYDTKNRLYYKVAMQAPGQDSIVWTPPAVFFTTKDPGITGVSYWVNDHGETTVLGIDLLLLDLSRLTSNTEISKRGTAFVLSAGESPRVLGLPHNGDELDDETIRARLLPAVGTETVADTAPELPVAGNSGNKALDAAVTQWRALGKPEKSLSYELDGETWWANFSHSDVGQNTFIVGAIAPQSDFLSGLGDAARRIALVTLIVIILSTIIAIRLANDYAKPLEALAEASRRLRNLDLSPTEAVDTRLSEIRELIDEHERTRLAIDSFSRYMPIGVVKDLIARGVAAKISGERREISILFTDIEGFTTIAESRTAEGVSELLSDYFETLFKTIQKNGGEVNQLLGDGVVAYWGAPTPDEKHAEHVVAGILECYEKLEKISAENVQKGHPPLPTRFGVASGEVMIGNTGSKSRIAYTAIGDTANLASRIEGLNRFYGTRLMVAKETRIQAGNTFEWRHVDGVKAKGKLVPVELYEPLGFKDNVEKDKLEFRDLYEKALYTYRESNFTSALDVLNTIEAPFNEDLSVIRLKNLCQEFLKTPPPKQWDGITDFVVK